MNSVKEGVHTLKLLFCFAHKSDRYPGHYFLTVTQLSIMSGGGGGHRKHDVF